MHFRAVIEVMFGRLKDRRRMATRYDPSQRCIACRQLMPQGVPFGHRSRRNRNTLVMSPEPRAPVVPKTLTTDTKNSADAQAYRALHPAFLGSKPATAPTRKRRKRGSASPSLRKPNPAFHPVWHTCCRGQLPLGGAWCFKLWIAPIRDVPTLGAFRISGLC